MTSLFITPAVAFLSGPSTLSAFSDAVAATAEYDTFLTGSADDFTAVLSQFMSLVGPEYARRYGLQKDMVSLREAKQADFKTGPLLVKGALASVADHVTRMSQSAPLVFGGALVLLQDEAGQGDEGAVHFMRFPRVKPVRLPEKQAPDTHDVEDVADPGEALKTTIPINLSVVDYREALGVSSSEEAISIFTNPLETPGRRILALKYWYFSLNGDALTRDETAKALLDILIQEDWGDFQEFSGVVLNNLLAEKTGIGILFYLRRLVEKIPNINRAGVALLKVLTDQLGGVLFQHADTLLCGPLEKTEFIGMRDFLLQEIFNPSKIYPQEVRLKAFYQWTCLNETCFKEGAQWVHDVLLGIASEEKDSDFLFALISDYIWRGPPLHKEKVLDVIEMVLRREDWKEETKKPFLTLLAQQQADALEKRMADGRSQRWFDPLLRFLANWRWLRS